MSMAFAMHPQKSSIKKTVAVKPTVICSDRAGPAHRNRNAIKVQNIRAIEPAFLVRFILYLLSQDNEPQRRQLIKPTSPYKVDSRRNFIPSQALAHPTDNMLWRYTDRCYESTADIKNVQICNTDRRN